MSDPEYITLTTIGGSTHIDYNGRRYVPWDWASRLVGEEVTEARADERERALAAIRDEMHTDCDSDDACDWCEQLVILADRIAREGGAP